jgi:hypothetical protein
MQLGWAVRARGPDLAPQNGSQPTAALFFLAFMTLTAFMTINLLTAAVADAYTAAQCEQGGTLFVTDSQKRWKEAIMLQKYQSSRRDLVIPPRSVDSDSPSGSATRWEAWVMRARAAASAVVAHPHFEHAVLGTIVANTVVMASEHHGQPAAFGAFVTYANAAFTTIFVVETGVKIAAAGSLKIALVDRWNRFDFSVTLLSVLDLLVSVFSDADSVPALGSLRMLRVARLFRLVANARGLRSLFRALVLSLPALLNVASVRNALETP